MPNTNDQVIDGFVSGASTGASGSLTFAGHVLMSYGEAIALRQNVRADETTASEDTTVFYVDTFTRYSVTSTQHVSKLRGALAFVEANGAIPGKLRKRGGSYVREPDLPVPGRIVVHRVDRETLRRLAGLADVPSSVTRKGPRLYDTKTGERLTRDW
jgi:hypothetical protein